MPYPTDLRYTKDHEWVRLSGDVAEVGITDYAQQQLGDVVYVELPAVGAKLDAGSAFGTIESVKAVSELFAPVSGAVTELNGTLKDHPEYVNSAPHETWMVRIKVADPSAVAALLDAAQYEATLS
jgi:glycine cleavage system H protein